MPDPPPIAGLGYTEVYSATGLDIFNNIGTNNVWANRDFWQGAPPAGAHTTSGTTLKLNSKLVDGYPNITVASLNLTTLASSLSFQGGFFEAVMRWTTGPGAWPGFWLLSKAHAQGQNVETSEFDIFEGQGTTPTEFSGALHRDTSGPFEEYRGCWTKPTGSPNLSLTHTFAGLWTSSQVKWYVDDELLCTQPTYGTTNQPMYVLFSMWIGGWAAGNVITGATPATLTLEIDSLSIWQPGTPATGVPVNVNLPAFSGTPQVGNVLTGASGSWTGATTITFAYQWQRCNTTGGACTNIAAATSSTYTLVNADVGSTVRLRVTATNGSGSTIAYSPVSVVVAGVPTGGSGAPINSSLPVILGTPRVGRTLTSTPGSWTGTTPTSFAYQWRRCDVNGANCSDIGGATSQTYVPVSADIGSRLRCRVTASN